MLLFPHSVCQDLVMVLFPPGGDTDYDFSNSIKGKLHLSEVCFVQSNVKPFIGLCLLVIML